MESPRISMRWALCTSRSRIKLILPFEGEAACHSVVQRGSSFVEIVPAKPNAIPGVGLKLFGFIAESVFAFIPGTLFGIIPECRSTLDEHRDVPVCEGHGNHGNRAVLQLYPYVGRAPLYEHSTIVGVIRVP